jgi:hypothetical protein
MVSGGDKMTLKEQVLEVIQQHTGTENKVLTFCKIGNIILSRLN